MPNADKFEVNQLPGLEETDKGLAFLQCATRHDINAKKEFDRLKPKLKQDVFNRFDHWIQGNHFNKYFHGFPGDPRYENLWIFKWRKAGTNYRLYGFLFNPRPVTDHGFQACVLVCHGQKPGNDQHDPAKLALAESLRLNLDVVKEVKKTFPEWKR